MNGLLTCLRYSLPPNSLSYCGPDKTANLMGYRTENIVDRGLAETLEQFDTLYRYLSFIAYENNIRNPFDPQVVEAYWIGNNLLSNISIRSLHLHLDESLKLKKKLPKKASNLLYDKLGNGTTPHHSFHVFNVFRRTGHLPIAHTLTTMDACRIGWGKITAINNNHTLEVSTKPLKILDGKLRLEKPTKKIIFNNIMGEKLFLNLKLDDWISFHWQVICDKLTHQQVQQLEKYTLQAIKLTNTNLA